MGLHSCMVAVSGGEYKSSDKIYNSPPLSVMPLSPACTCACLKLEIIFLLVKRGKRVAKLRGLCLFEKTEKSLFLAGTHIT